MLNALASIAFYGAIFVVVGLGVSVALWSLYKAVSS